MNDGDKRGLIAQPSPTRRRLELAAVVVVSLVVSLPFCNKAFHIDDPLYLSIARQILVDPLRPFDGIINWQQITERAWNVSISPPGFSYWLAAWMALGVSGEVGLHLTGCFWVVVLGLATYAWGRRLGEWPVAAALIVVSSPLVVAGQNLMIDVPMLALASSAVAVYLRACDKNSVGIAVAAGLLAGLAVNFKYAGVVAIFVMIVDAIVWRRWRMLAAGVIGLALFAAGQLASMAIYGEPQLLHARDWIQRLWPSGVGDVLHRTSTAVVYLGASAAWLVLLAGRVFQRSWSCMFQWAVSVAGSLGAIVDLRSQETQVSAIAMIHVAAFALGGWMTIAWLLVNFLARVRELIRGGWSQAAAAQSVSSPLRHAVMLFVWTVGFWYLGTLNGPFVAPRALLPCVLSLVLAVMALAPATTELGAFARRGAVVVTLVIGLVVGAADAHWAGIYREWAPRLADKYRPQTGTLYFLGHWGWQSYAEAASMAQFDPASTRLVPGDVLILPENTDCPLPLNLVLRGCVEIASDSVPGSVWLPRTRDPRRFVFLHGDTARGRIPWAWAGDDHPQETFHVYRHGR